MAYHDGDYESAERIFRESLALYRGHGLKDRVAGALSGLGDLARLAGDNESAGALYEESPGAVAGAPRHPGDCVGAAQARPASLAMNDTRSAWARLTESLALQRELGNKQGIGECLAGLAAAAAASGQPERAAEVFAASAALVADIGIPLSPVDQLTLAQDMDAVRARLGTSAWEAAWATGSALSTDEAVQLAVVDGNGPPLAAAAEAGASPVGVGSSALSPRELEVVQLLARGLTNREIASALAISEKTVGTHIDHIMTKVGLRSRTLIALWAVEGGLKDSPG